ncbi:MAG: response regulator [Candidatus Rokubacteria bacterium]|nr:response regulator [Candidatus Rokubacteria bacterium]
MTLGRRRYPRIAITFPVRLEDSAGRTWHGESLNLSAGGVKVKSPARLQPGRRVRLNFKLPDGGPGISAASLTVRQDPNGPAFSFVDLEGSAFDRIGRLVGSFRPRRRLKVLVIEEERAEAEAVSGFIRDQGHEALLAENAEVGLELLDRFQPDAMIVDVFLPGMSGVQLLQLLAGRRPSLPSVVISRVGLEEEAGQCFRLGALDFMRKPVCLDRLQAILDFLELQAFDWRLVNWTRVSSIS